MNKLLKTGLSIFSCLAFVALLFQNCGPARLRGSLSTVAANAGSGDSSSGLPDGPAAPAPGTLPTSLKTQILALPTPSLSIASGQTVTIPLRFEVPEKMSEDYVVFVAFVDSQGNEAGFSGGGLPLVPTSQWTGSTTVQMTFQIPAGTPAGSFSIRAGLYRNLDAPNNKRLGLEAGPGVSGDLQLRYAVGNLTVTP